AFHIGSLIFTAVSFGQMACPARQQRNCLATNIKGPRARWTSTSGEQAPVAGGRTPEFGPGRTTAPPHTSPELQRTERPRGAAVGSFGWRAPAIRRERGQQRVPQTPLSRRQERRLERLALAKPQPYTHARSAREDRRGDGRRAR